MKCNVIQTLVGTLLSTQDDEARPLELHRPLPCALGIKSVSKETCALFKLYGNLFPPIKMIVANLTGLNSNLQQM